LNFNTALDSAAVYIDNTENIYKIYTMFKSKYDSGNVSAVLFIVIPV